MKNPNWDRYQIFLHVARQGGLTAAASLTGLSPATIGRHMVELERQLGRALFVRSQGGYALTADGRQLTERLSEMEAAARAVEAWREDSAAPALVRIAAGTWNAWLIAENFPAIRSDRDLFRVDLYIAEQRASLSYRENDIGIRAFEPEELNLAAVPAGEVAYAAYQARNLQTVGPGNSWPSGLRMRCRPICAGRTRNRKASSSPSIGRAPCATWRWPVQASPCCPASSAIWRPGSSASATRSPNCATANGSS